jgi:hypothetical protein
MIGSFMPWLEKERIGPFSLTPYVYSMFVLIAPTVLLIAAVFFSVAALTRSVMATYASAVALLVGYIVAGAIVGNNLENEKVASLFDPFALTSFGLATRYWTVIERNTQVLPVEGVFLWNRIIWIAVSIAIFAFALWRFKFETGSRKSRKKAKAVPSPQSKGPGEGPHPPSGHLLPQAGEGPGDRNEAGTHRTPFLSGRAREALRVYERRRELWQFRRLRTGSRNQASDIRDSRGAPARIAASYSQNRRH